MTVWVKTTLTSRAFLRGLGEVFAHWLNSLPACDGGVRVLRVMSHGHSLATLDGTVVGSDISVGKTENIRSTSTMMGTCLLQPTLNRPRSSLMLSKLPFLLMGG